MGRAKSELRRLVASYVWLDALSKYVESGACVVVHGGLLELEANWRATTCMLRWTLAVDVCRI